MQSAVRADKRFAADDGPVLSSVVGSSRFAFAASPCPSDGKDAREYCGTCLASDRELHSARESIRHTHLCSGMMKTSIFRSGERPWTIAGPARLSFLQVPLALLTAAGGTAVVTAQPSELYGRTENTSCTDVSTADLIDLSCSGEFRVFETFRGRIASDPLRYTGPIMVEVEARRVVGTRFPLFIEFVAVKDHPRDLGFCDGPAQVLMTAFGSTRCGEVESSGPIRLEPWLSPGDTYVIRVHFFGDPQIDFESPYFRCLRVSPTTSISEGSWGQIKALYH
jgi:hypothetical protein